MLTGQILIVGYGAWPFWERRHQVFLDNRPFASESFLVLKFQHCPGPLVPEGRGGRGQNFGSGYSWRSQFSPLGMLPLHDLQFWFWSVFSKKQLSILLNMMGPL